MRFYVASKFEGKKEVLAFYEELKRRGHELAADWTWHKPIKPYEKNPGTARDYAVEDIEGVKNADVFVVLGGEGELSPGVCTELGAAILSNSRHGKPEVYLVGNPKNKTMFVFHPSVKIRESLAEVLEEIGEVKK